VPAQCHDACCLEPRGTASDDDDPAGPRCLVERAPFLLASGDRVVDAADREAKIDVPNAALGAGDAGADVVDRAGADLVGEMRVSDRRARHASLAK